MVKIVQSSVYRNARSHGRVNGTFSDDFLAQVGLHQTSVLHPLLRIIVLEALSRNIRSWCPEELPYADNMELVSETHEGLKGRLEAWKGVLESKGLRVNVKKT